jgi:hypothetical protein
LGLGLVASYGSETRGLDLRQVDANDRERK